MTTEKHQCRHQIPAITDEASPMLAFVGWDRMLNTFFLQVGPPDPDEPDEIDGERMVKWIGTSWGEIPTVEALAAVTWNGHQTPWAQLSQEMVEHLTEYQQLRPAGERQTFGLGF